MSKTTRFFDGLRGKRVAFIGTGVSHNELISLFLRKGIDVTVLDRKTEDKYDQELLKRFKESGAKFRTGESYLDSLSDFDVVYRTPGMYYNHPKLLEAREMGVVITSEMESFFELCPCRIFAVTGSNGKTTTTTLISEFLKAEGYTVWLGGNIGNALLPRIESISEDDYAVVELSSFQLISMRQSPDVAVVTNISPNHLDVHRDMEEYVAAKCNILDHQSAFSKAVINADDPGSNELRSRVRGALNLFSLKEKPAVGGYLDKNRILCYRDGRKSVKIMPAQDLRLPGEHNIENVLAAICAVWGDVSAETIVKVAKKFSGVEHRIEFVRELDGVKYYNDSEATSPQSTVVCLKSFGKRIIVIAGGYDKMIPFEPLAKPMNDYAKVLILIGATANKIESAVVSADNFDPRNLKIMHACSMKEAVDIARAESVPGDVVAMSPACASFDMYPNCLVRGRDFKALVKALK